MLWQLLIVMLGTVIPFPKDKVKRSQHKETLDGDVKKIEKAGKTKKPMTQKAKVLQGEFGKLQKEYAKPREQVEQVEKDTSLGQRIKSAVRNVGNVAKNAFDNTMGYGIAAYQNNRAVKQLANDPSKQVVYLMHGFAQNKGSQWRLAKELKKKGVVAYHVAGRHNLDDKENLEQTYGQIKEFHSQAGTKDIGSRNDLFSGHSSGGDLGIYMAGDGRAKWYGIKGVEARAPAPTGIKAATIGQRLLMPFVTKDNVNTYVGKKHAVDTDKRMPKIPVHIVAGKHDRLVRPKETLYKHASSYTLLDHPDSTHFGTSGSNKHMNRMTADRLAKLAAQKGDTYTGAFGYEKGQQYEPSAHKKQA